MERWNPLEIINLSETNNFRTLAISSTKQQIRNILKSYVGYFDPFCELFQNAMDATDRREKSEHEHDYKKNLYIKINLSDNSIYVADNGIGFTHDQFRSFMSPNITYKSAGEARGNKGVGTTYLAYGFHKMVVYTKTKDFTQYAEIRDARNWVDDKTDQIDMPFVEPLNMPDKDFPFSQGTSFKLFFTDDQGRRLKDLSWLGITTAEKWCSILLSNTPLGHVTTDQTASNVIFNLDVIDESQHITSVSAQEASFFYPHLFFSINALNLDDLINWQKAEIEKQRDVSRIPQRFKKKLCYYKFYTTHEIVALANRSKTLTDEEMIMIRQYSLTAYGYFCNSVDRWSDINKKFIGIKRNTNYITFGLQLATDNMIQGSSLQIPLTSNIGFQKQSQVIIHLNGAEPDLGRKGFQPEVRQLAERISSMIVSLGLSPRRELLSADGNYNKRDNELRTLHEIIRATEEHEDSKPLMINNESFFLPIKQISITSAPLVEQDVVVLFNQLLAGGVIRSIELMASSSRNQYDGIFRIRVLEPIENHYYHISDNPLGISRENPISAGKQTAPQFLEYKYSFDNLIQDFDNEDKHPKDLGLVVVWTMGSGRWKERFQVISYLLSEYQDRRPYHGLTHEVFDSVSSNQRVFYCVVLEELIGYLNNPQMYTVDFGQIYAEI